MDFKVSYLDAGLATTYFDGDVPTPSSGPKLNPRRYKTQLRDFLSSCRTKRKPTASDIYPDSASFAAYASPAAGYMGASLPGGGLLPALLLLQLLLVLLLIPRLPLRSRYNLVYAATHGLPESVPWSGQ